MFVQRTAAGDDAVVSGFGGLVHGERAAAHGDCATRTAHGGEGLRFVVQVHGASGVQDERATAIERSIFCELQNAVLDFDHSCEGVGRADCGGAAGALEDASSVIGTIFEHGIERPIVRNRDCEHKCPIPINRAATLFQRTDEGALIDGEGGAGNHDNHRIFGERGVAA